MKKLLKPLLPLLYSFLKSNEGKKLILGLLKAAAKQTNNQLDDQAVDFIKARLYPSNTPIK